MIQTREEKNVGVYPVENNGAQHSYWLCTAVHPQSDKHGYIFLRLPFPLKAFKRFADCQRVRNKRISQIMAKLCLSASLGPSY